MPPIAYALASDTLITVVRAQALARHPARAPPTPPRLPPSAAWPCGCCAWPWPPPPPWPDSAPGSSPNARSPPPAAPPGRAPLTARTGGPPRRTGPGSCARPRPPASFPW
jgi:hypothetical protein